MIRRLISRFLTEYTMLAVLLLVCAYYSWATIGHQSASGAAGGGQSAKQLLAKSPNATVVVIVVGTSSEDVGFADEASRRLQAGGVSAVSVLTGTPAVVRAGLQQMIATQRLPDAILCTSSAGASLEQILRALPAISSVRTITPQPYDGSTFLTLNNLTNIANNIVVISIIAVGMTMVIITGGIDLSVGSLMALSAVITGVLIRDHAGATHAGTSGMILCSVAAILVCGLVGAFSGAIVTLFKVPPFIITLAMMLVASGLAYKLSQGESIYEIPTAFTWLGLGIGVAGIPNEILLMVAIYAAAYAMMSRTRLGRYIYAVGGNAEAARLSGVGVGGVLITVYIISGLAAGMGGVIITSQLGGGSPTYGLSYELYVIAAVVVGGTSLSGGEGNVVETLIGALIIAVIQNGMNLTGVGDYSQRIVLGLVILGAVLLDSLKRTTWRLPDWIRLPGSEPAEVSDNTPERETSGAVHK